MIDRCSKMHGMEPIAVDVVLYGGYPQHFMQGRAWKFGVDGLLYVTDTAGQVIATIAEGRWEAVGYRYTPVEKEKPAPKKLSARSVRQIIKNLR